MILPNPEQQATEAPRIGAVDIGSNAIRSAVADLAHTSSLERLDYQRIPVRLGHSAFMTGRLDPDRIDAATAALASFKVRFDELGVVEHRVVATSAVRDSENGAELIDRTLKETGFAIETISGDEEARLVWSAVKVRLPLTGRWMLADLGGGSLEISRVEDERLEWSQTYPIGAVRLLEILGAADNDPAGMQDALTERIRALELPVWEGEAPHGLVATGGNIAALARVAGVDPDAHGLSRLPVARLRETNEQLARMSRKERMQRLRLKPDRADVIVPAGIVYAWVAELAGAHEILVPHVGVLDGLLLELAADLRVHGFRVSPQEREVYAAALALGSKSSFDEAHGRHVAKLAVSLFDQMKPLHALGPVDRRILIGAALLHDIGQSVSYRKHHKHSMDLILEHGLPTFTREEVPLVGLVARYHRRAEPQDHHDIWSDLEVGDQGRVVKLASILRVADVLDRDHAQRVKTVRVQLNRDVAVIEPDTAEELGIVKAAFEAKASLFEKTFGRPTRLAATEVEAA
jgi:exopolyphosphatase/guanosine-5'-triphosphate,3'-diphosphate pyrophosphatase